MGRRGWVCFGGEDGCTQAYKCWETKAVIKGRYSNSLLNTGKDLSDGLVSAPIFHLLIRFPGLLSHSKREGRGNLRVVKQELYSINMHGSEGFAAPKLP